MKNIVHSYLKMSNSNRMIAINFGSFRKIHYFCSIKNEVYHQKAIKEK